MAVYSVRGFAAATVATANHCIADLWNPHASRRMEILEVGVYKAGTTGARPRLVRTNGRGTPGSTVTPDADNSWEGGDDAPPSGALLDLAAFSVQPSITDSALGAELGRGTGSGGTGYVWTFPKGLELIGGSARALGLAIIQGTAVIWPTSEVYFVWEED